MIFKLVQVGVFRVLGIMKFTVRKSSSRRNKKPLKNNDNVEIEVTKNHPNKHLKFKSFSEVQTHFKVTNDNTERNDDEKDLKTREN